ncbi:hypothetical protein ACIRPH_28375 [Nocardiopsis sp. NPDC101807]|uniref:hypothetical protein n=1 Tax=Nocardiopsis sp. NPDC101807 TaxID=3364339 RepID=UPI0037FC96D8
MNSDRTPEEIAAERIVSDPGFAQRRLNEDLIAVAELGRTGSQIDPRTDAVALSEAIRMAADQIGFASPVEAATQAKRRLIELPVVERKSGSAIHAYHEAASATMRDGVLSLDDLLSDGTRVLGFQRQGQEAELVSISLSARIRVEPDGQVHLDSFGWPESPQHPIHSFNGSAGDHLTRAVADLYDPGMPLDRAMIMLLGATRSWPTDTDTRQERTRIAELVTLRRGELNGYVRQAETYALASASSGWYPACLYRSALENLFEAFLGSVSLSLVDMEDIEAIDEELRKGLPEAEAAVSTAVPLGIPPHHWWWGTATQ